MFLSGISQFAYLIRCVSKEHSVSYPSSQLTDKVKMHLTEAIHSWLAMAPMREHSPHNNELLRLPEDTMPVQRIEIKRQAICGKARWGKGGGKGGYEFNIEQMWDILHPEWMKRSIAYKCWIKAHMMGIKPQLKRWRLTLAVKEKQNKKLVRVDAKR